jgi:hypothetical protein
MFDPLDSKIAEATAEGPSDGTPITYPSDGDGISNGNLEVLGKGGCLRIGNKKVADVEILCSGGNVDWAMQSARSNTRTEQTRILAAMIQLCFL